MFVSGFTIIRNAIKADYPIKEAVFSILPLCDEVIIAVGKSDDNTLELIKSFDSPKIKIIETEWDDTLRDGGKLLADETNKALANVDPKASWCVYIQADECLHENDFNTIKNAMQVYEKDSNIYGLLFNYKHFYGSYDYLADSRNWYRKEIRIIKNNPEIVSYKDAQGFRFKNNKKLKVKAIGANVFHYGWVKHPKLQLEKLKQARKLWHNDAFLEKEYQNQEAFDFNEVDSLSIFKGTHPEVIKARINEKNWQFDHDITKKNMGLKKRFLYWIEQRFGWRIGEYKNYIKI